MKTNAFLGAGFALLLLLAPATAGAEGVTVIRDEEIEQTLKTFGRPVFEQAGLSPENVRFILLQKDDLNAFVAGGQNIFFHTGLLLETQNAAEVAGVIAHEAGHIASGHLFRTKEAADNLSIQAMLAQILGIAAAITTQSAEVGMAIGSAGQSLTHSRFLRHSRVQETAADQAGVRFLSGAGLPLSGFLTFMQELASQELLPESQQSEYVRTHPLTSDRVDFLRNENEKLKTRATPPSWDEKHARLKAKLKGFIYPDRTLAEKDTTTTAGRYGRAIALYRKRRLNEALQILDALIAAEPENPYFHELKGQALFENGRIEEALASYKKAVTGAPKSGLIRAAYGHALLEKKKTDAKTLAEAVRQLQMALRLEPRQSSTHHFLAIAYGKQGREGLSRLHLAEQALMENKPDFAKREALLAIESLPAAKPSARRAQEILEEAEKLRKKKKP